MIASGAGNVPSAGAAAHASTNAARNNARSSSKPIACLPSYLLFVVAAGFLGQILSSYIFRVDFSSVTSERTKRCIASENNLKLIRSCLGRARPMVALRALHSATPLYGIRNYGLACPFKYDLSHKAKSSNTGETDRPPPIIFGLWKRTLRSPVSSIASSSARRCLLWLSDDQLGLTGVAVEPARHREDVKLVSRSSMPWKSATTKLKQHGHHLMPQRVSYYSPF